MDEEQFFFRIYWQGGEEKTWLIIEGEEERVSKQGRRIGEKRDGGR